MKEAAGEANMTVITIVLIAIVLGVGTVLVNQLLGNTAKKSACSEAGGSLKGNVCTYTTATGASANCEVKKCSDGKTWYCEGVTSCS